MSYSFYVSQLENLHFLNDTLKKSLGSLKFANANCTETSLMLNKIEEELKENEQSIDEFNNFLLIDITNLLKVYENNEQYTIKEMFEKINHDLLVSAHKIGDLKKEHTFDIDDLENETKQDMSYSPYVSQLEDLYLLNDTSKKSLGLLKFLNANCPERILMLNKIEEEVNEIGQRIDALDTLLLKDNTKLLKVYQNNEQGIIKKMFEEIRHDLSLLARKITDLKKEHNIDIDNVQNKTKQNMPYSPYVSKLKDLYRLHGTFKKSLGSLKFVNANCPETSLVLNKIEEELNEIEQIIAEFDNLLLNGNRKMLKVYLDNGRPLIKEIYENIHSDLLVMAHKISDLVEERVNKYCLP